MKSKLLLTSLALALGLAAACNESFPRELAPPPVRDPLLARPSNTTCLAPTNPLGRVRLEPTYQGFYRPLAMIDRPDLGLIYVAEMPGTVKVIDRATGAITTALDLVGKGAGTFYEQGLLGLAIHPTEPYAYIVLERDEDATTLEDLPYRAELLRFTTNDGGRTFDPASEKLLYRIDRPTFLHYPGTLEFGPDGLLYLGIGDGGSYLIEDFPKKHPDTLLGTIVRFDVDAGTPPEVFARGFRNPWRFTFDRQNGEIWGGDVGEIRYEEVNKIEQGKDYGWPTVEGSECFRPRVGCDHAGLTPPVYDYPHAEGASVTGGYVYRGAAMPELTGKYVFGDFIVGRIWELDTKASQAKAVLLNPGGVKPSISSFGQDADGELYALDWQGGTIYKLVRGEPESRPILPGRLSQTGCVDPADPKRPAPGLVPYDVNVELWSDGAEKRRFVAIPDGTTIHVEEDGDLSIPEGSVVVKEFAIAGKRIETRFLLHHPGGDWSGATYEWNDEQTDAYLLDGAKEKVLPTGQTWPFPSPAQCFVCHTKGAKMTLGLEALQLNRDFSYGTGDVANQLTKLSDIGYLDRRLDPHVTPRLPALTSAAPAEERARAYLHANCSMCHRKDTGTGARMDLRFGLPLAAIEGCRPSAFHGVDDVKILAPGDPAHSAIFLRVTNREGYQMPPLGTHVVDQVAASVIEEWILKAERCAE